MAFVRHDDGIYGARAYYKLRPTAISRRQNGASPSLVRIIVTTCRRPWSVIYQASDASFRHTAGVMLGGALMLRCDTISTSKRGAAFVREAEHATDSISFKRPLLVDGGDDFSSRLAHAHRFLDITAGIAGAAGRLAMSFDGGSPPVIIDKRAGRSATACHE